MPLRVFSGFLTAFSLALAVCFAQSEKVQEVPASPYTFHIPVNEISLRFHATDSKNRPLTQLTVRDLAVSDNGKPQNDIVMLKPLLNLPIRAGFLFDASGSMIEDIDFDRSVIRTYASRLLRRGADKAFVMQFDTEPLMLQNWTDESSSIAAGAAAVRIRPGRHNPLTAIFDTLYRACRDDWNANPLQSTGNFIVLFSDGQDDASHVYLSEAVDMCQRRHVAIYVLYPGRSGRYAGGHQTLEDLASQTGGCAFIHPRRSDIWKDLREIEEEQRNQYLLVYKRSNLKADRSFHTIQLRCLIPGSRVVVRSGYYAFARP
ncbi:MAG TPA: VWA domain-containing protein [Acidobacteriaceae bacterium]|nr:VWA domain-containing protein [Acidobacteriaceae bacterium]